MDILNISDVTMKSSADAAGLNLSFREKIELSRLLDRLCVSVIELEPVSNPKVDSLRIKSIASAVKNSILAVPCGSTRESADVVWAALKTAAHPRLQLHLPVSPVQMEYLYHMKPAALLDLTGEMISYLAGLCPDVEFIADDATRADRGFLYRIIQTAIACGAGTVTVCDTSGSMLPDEFSDFIKDLYLNIPELSSVTLGAACSDALSLASASAVKAVEGGARLLKASAFPVSGIRLSDLNSIVCAKGEQLGITCTLRSVEMKRILSQIERLCRNAGHYGLLRPSASDIEETETASFALNADDSRETVEKAVKALGYELTSDELEAVYEAFGKLTDKKEGIDPRELEAIVASSAMQVPATFKISDYVVSTGSGITSMAHVRLLKNGQLLEGVSLGDGPIDAVFKAAETVTGTHYELDDFQIRAITEGREAMGETIVRLICGGRLYSGRGLSTDIVEAGLRAYINAVNKIVYEEAEG